MKLIVINGSPRGKSSNSKVITDWMLPFAGKDAVVEEYFAAKTKTHEDVVKSIEDDATILAVFPLYTDSVAGLLKQLFEEMETIRGRQKGVKIYFVVQSGFHGANHSRFVEKYLVWFAGNMGFEYMGTAVKPAGEGLRVMPESWTRKTRECFETLGGNVGAGSRFDEDALKKLAKREKPSALFRWSVRHNVGTSVWFNNVLKKNNAFDNRYDRPYVD